MPHEAYYFMSSEDLGKLYAVFSEEKALITVFQADGNTLVAEMPTTSAQGGHLYDWAMSRGALPIVEVATLAEAVAGGTVTENTTDEAETEAAKDAEEKAEDDADAAGLTQSDSPRSRGRGRRSADVSLSEDTVTQDATRDQQTGARGGDGSGD